MQIVSIVSGLPPTIDGVGDYALNLAQQLRKDFAIDTHFIVGNPKWVGEDEIEGFSVSKVSDRSVSTLLSLLNNNSRPSTVILLHYVSYAYAKRGCPFWLIDGLQQWRNTRSDRTLVTMFHELYATGPIWASSFWLSPVQKNLASRLSRLSDRCLTSKQIYANLLYKLSLGQKSQVPILPVFSNIGEPEQAPSLAERCQRLVVFGGSSTRRRVYQRSLTALGNICQELAIEEIIDIGPPIGLKISDINGVPMVAMGKTAAEEVSKILSSSIVGFFDYPLDYLAKSTIFAAYCAHKMIPIGTFYAEESRDGLEVGKHYWLADRPLGKLSLELGQTIADNAYTWYQTHNLSQQAKTFASYLTENKEN
ncbi:glycosyltransferase [Phormidium sp. LEGE 05292]|uniref:glycosyltransferase n=1 Tax=[Phormidium] sp. LEGE 05292 TaxID=767427 RepID=UPI0018829340|nr:glycosyltransferase [Phormidium sp. LEGE 05292]MBE9224276.1 glycosyltransferase [Phormidium sp. LEGE 05292]